MVRTPGFKIEVDWKQPFKALHQIEKQQPQLMRKEIFKYSENVSKALKRRVAANIDALGRFAGKGHSTPISIKRFLHRMKKKNNKKIVSHKVWMEPYPSTAKWAGKTTDVVASVEFGTRPHPIPRVVQGEIRGWIQHQGAKPTNFWSNSVKEWPKDIVSETTKLSEGLKANIVEMSLDTMLI